MMNLDELTKQLTNEYTPLVRLEDALFVEKKVEVWLKRDDLLFTSLGNAFVGNKWRKMKHNLLTAAANKQQLLLTFGGAFSNHIAATAAAGNAFGFDTIGVIRGEEILPLNDTLAQAKADGMQLHYVSRSDYRLKKAPVFMAKLRDKFGDFFMIPEGGSNGLALEGCTEITSEIHEQMPSVPTHICSACGTGGTLAGMILGGKKETHFFGFAALKGSFHTEEVTHFLAQSNSKPRCDWRIVNDYHLGGFAKYNEDLVRFINAFKHKHSIQLEPLYTGKMMYGLYDMIESDKFEKGSKIVAVHTGGLQGIVGFNKRYKNKNETIEL